MLVQIHHGAPAASKIFIKVHSGLCLIEAVDLLSKGFMHSSESQLSFLNVKGISSLKNLSVSLNMTFWEHERLENRQWTYTRSPHTCNMSFTIINLRPPPSLIEQVIFYHFMCRIGNFQPPVREVCDISWWRTWTQIKMTNGFYDPTCTPLSCMDYLRVTFSIFSMPLQQFLLGIANLCIKLKEPKNKERK